MKWNDFKEVPNTPADFLKYLLERMSCIAGTHIMRKRSTNLNDLLHPIADDFVIPSVHVVKSFLKKCRMDEKDHTMVYVLAKYHSVMASASEHASAKKQKKVLKCLLKFYKSMSISNLQSLNGKITKICQELKAKLAFYKDLDQIRQKLVPKLEKDEFVCNFMINIYGLKEALLGMGEDEQNLMGQTNSKPKIDAILIDQLVERSKKKKNEQIAKIEYDLLQIRNQEAFKKPKSNKSRKRTTK